MPQYALSSVRRSNAGWSPNSKESYDDLSGILVGLIRRSCSRGAGSTAEFILVYSVLELTHHV